MSNPPTDAAVSDRILLQKAWERFSQVPTLRPNPRLYITNLSDPFLNNAVICSIYTIVTSDSHFKVFKFPALHLFYNYFMYTTETAAKTFEEVKTLLEKDGYAIKKSLGKGAFGEVFMVEKG